VSVKSFSRHQLSSPSRSHSRHGTITLYFILLLRPYVSYSLALSLSLSNSFRISLPLRYIYRTHIREWQHGLCRFINYRFYISYFKGEGKRNRPRHHRRHYNAMYIYIYALYTNAWYPKPSSLFSTFNLSSIPTTLLSPGTHSHSHLPRRCRPRS